MLFVPVNAAQLVPPTGIFETVGGGFPCIFDGSYDVQAGLELPAPGARPINCRKRDGHLLAELAPGGALPTLPQRRLGETGASRLWADHKARRRVCPL
jgi:hypothetical protein